MRPAAAAAALLALAGCAASPSGAESGSPESPATQGSAAPPAPSPSAPPAEAPAAPRPSPAAPHDDAAPVADDGPGATDAALASAPEVLRRVVPRVEEECGAPFATAPRVLLLPEEEAEAAFTEDLKDEVARRFPQASEGQRATLLRVAASNAARSCVARYSASARAIVLVREGFERQRAGLRVPAARLLLASLCHEAVHALDDQRFGLAALYRGVRDDEALRARAMLVEGRATYFGRRAAAGLGLPPGDDSLFLPGGREVRGEREWMLRMTYALGERFVAVRGREIADRALASPPDLTWHLCVPARWPDASPDGRPARILEAAGMGAPKPVSELQLRVRYTVLEGPSEAEALLARYQGGAQVLEGGTNAAVLAFADEAAAQEFELRLRQGGGDPPTVARVGALVLRAEGADVESVLRRLAAAVDASR